jgi:aspartate/methionine/tyrosine aminotransferase
VKTPADRAAALRRSEIRVLFDAAARIGGDVIRLEVGEPSFTTPAHVIDAAARAAHDGHTGYGPNGGLASLRELLADKLRRVNGIEASTDEIVVTPGAMNALYSIYLALLEPGDEVLLPTPGFPNMDETVAVLGGRPVFYRLAADGGFLPDIEALEALVTERTKVLFVNTPANPTGAVYGAALMGDLVDFASRHDLWLLCDEVYDEMVLSDGCVHTAAAPLDSDGRVITVCSFSKVYAMTGWRVGYVAAPAEMADLLRKLQEPLVSCPSTISQKAAEAALTGPREPYEQMLAAYRSRRAVALDTAASAGVRAVASDGTLYMLLDVSASGADDLDFALRLLESHSVSVAPGSVFGPAGRGWARISLAAEEEAIAEGLRRLAKALHE